MKEKYDLIFVTHLPAFYKVNLYNEICKSKKIFVIFISLSTQFKRSNDFISIEKANFPYKTLSEGFLERRSIIKNILKLENIYRKIEANEIILPGWDLIESWYLIFRTIKCRISLVVESTIHESKTTGLKGLIKKLFLFRINKVYAAGESHFDLIDNLKYRGTVVVTNGVGLINKTNAEKRKKNSVLRSLIYVGRLSSEKNLAEVIAIINEYSWLQLNIYGSGPDEIILKSKSKQNINFHGEISNSELPKILALSDYLILPSKVEPWGLVIDEALHFGTPVLVSSACGSRQLVKPGYSGYVFDILNFRSEFIGFIENYNQLYLPPCHSFLEQADQVSAFL